MILSATLSKPVANIEEILGKPLNKIKINYENTSNGGSYFLQEFSKTQVFHRHLKETELEEFLQQHAGTTFKNCIEKTETKEITILANKKGKITRLEKIISSSTINSNNPLSAKNNSQIIMSPLAQKKKNYLLPEGKPVPFLVLLGIMNSDGKVINAKYDKFRQINRFLEFIDDVIRELKIEENSSVPLNIIDFGCGKSYLTFAVHYYLTQIRHINSHIEGLDLKQEVIDYCNDITKKLKLENLIFHTGDIADYSRTQNPDLIITLHACDTATDYALEYAVSKGSKAILCVPCCQHQVNAQLNSNLNELLQGELSPLLKYGLIREKFASLVTDALRGEWLESKGYKVQMLEFIDSTHTPKNILIRAVKKQKADSKDKPALLTKLKITPEVWAKN